MSARAKPRSARVAIRWSGAVNPRGSRQLDGPRRQRSLWTSQTTAWTRVRTPSRRQASARWSSTVRAEISRRAPISREPKPCAASLRQARWRSDRTGREVDGRGPRGCGCGSVIPLLKPRCDDAESPQPSRGAFTVGRRRSGVLVRAGCRQSVDAIRKPGLGGVVARHGL